MGERKETAGEGSKFGGWVKGRLLLQLTGIQTVQGGARDSVRSSGLDSRNCEHPLDVHAACQVSGCHAWL